MEHTLGHDLFLLMLNLSQLRDPDRTVALFIESMNAMQPHLRLRLLDARDPEDDHTVPIATSRYRFGRIALDGDVLVPSTAQMLVRNAVKMLAVVLENQKQRQLLADENALLEASVQERTAALQASEERFRNTFEQAAVGIAHIAPDSRILRVNRRFCEIVGRSTDDVLALTIPDITHPDDIGLDIENARRTLAAELSTYTTEKRYLLPNGEPVWVNLTTSLVRNVAGEPEYFIAVIEDITRRKQTEAELAQYRERLEDLVEARTAELKHTADHLRERSEQLEAVNAELRALSKLQDEFVSHVSHELRTPITNMMMREHLLGRQPEALEEHLAVIVRETERLSRIIDDLLALTRLEQDHEELHMESVDVCALVQEYVLDRRSLARAKQLVLRLDTQTDRPFVAADAGLLGQALSVLLTNAINYTPAGETITVRVTDRQVNERRWVGIAVHDSGPGIAPSEQARLFARFYRGTAGRNSGTPGTGLGLTILQQIVDRHGGEVEVISAGLGQGATFTIWLPALDGDM